MNSKSLIKFSQKFVEIKRIFILLISFAISALILNTSINNVKAQQQGSTDTTTTTQSDTIKDTSKLFEVELQVGTQSAWTKSIPVYIKFRSTVDADNVQISWDVPAGLKYTMNHTQFISVKKDQVYTYNMTLSPESSGDYNIGGNVTLWQFNTNYTSASNVNVKIGTDLLVQPQTAGYIGGVILKYIIIVLLIILGGIGIYFAGKKALELLKEWLKPPE